MPVAWWGDARTKKNSTSGLGPYIIDHSTPAWTSPGPSAGPFEVELIDGSRVTYFWYKFIHYLFSKYVIDFAAVSFKCLMKLSSSQSPPRSYDARKSLYLEVMPCQARHVIPNKIKGSDPLIETPGVSENTQGLNRDKFIHCRLAGWPPADI